MLICRLLHYTRNSEFLMHDFIDIMTNKFGTVDLGFFHYFLGMEVSQLNDAIFISKGKYVVDLLDKFKMTNCKLPHL